MAVSQFLKMRDPPRGRRLVAVLVGPRITVALKGSQTRWSSPTADGGRPGGGVCGATVLKAKGVQGESPGLSEGGPRQGSRQFDLANCVVSAQSPLPNQTCGSSNQAKLEAQ